MSWHLFVYIGILIFYNTLLRIISSMNWLKTDKKFIIKKIIDCMVPFGSYAILVYGYYVFAYILQSLSIWLLIVPALFVVCSFTYYSTSEILRISKYTSKQIKGAQTGYILLGLFSTLLVAITMINYISYILCPNFYDIPNGLNHAAIGFEFIYYTFTLMMTYSGTSISALHVVSKLLQIIEIITFYVFVGVFFINLFMKCISARGFSIE